MVLKKWINRIFWSLFFVGAIFLMGFAKKHQAEQIMETPDIKITIQDDLVLLTKEELLERLTSHQFFQNGMTRDEVRLKEMEQFLLEQEEIQEVDVYKKLGNQWTVKVLLKRPIARILLPNSDGFYIDNRGFLMDIPANFRPRVLTVTGLEKLIPQSFQLKNVINNDSLITKYKLDETYRISNYVCNSAFYDAQIVQLHYDEQDVFVLIPRVGGHQIVFGMANSDEAVAKKFGKLTTFYEEVIPYEGWNTYQSINLRYKNQIVAKKK
jgi:cell division protein FtsQ